MNCVTAGIYNYPWPGADTHFSSLILLSIDSTLLENFTLIFIPVPETEVKYLHLWKKS